MMYVYKIMNENKFRKEHMYKKKIYIKQRQNSLGLWLLWQMIIYSMTNNDTTQTYIY